MVELGSEELKELNADVGSVDALSNDNPLDNEVYDESDGRQGIQETETNPEADQGQGAESWGQDEEDQDYEGILDSAGDKKRGMQEVPVSFLKKTREDKKRLREYEEAEKKRLQNENTQYQTLLRETLAPKQEPINPYASIGEMPDATYDPQGAIEWMQKKNDIDQRELRQQQAQIAQQTQYMQAVQNMNMREGAYEAQNQGYMQRKKQYLDDAVNRAAVLYGEQEAANMRNRLEYDLMVRVDGMLKKGIQDPIAVIDSQLQAIIPAQATTGTVEKPKRDIAAANKNAQAQKSVGKAGAKSSASGSGMPSYDEVMTMSGTDIAKVKKKFGVKAWNEHLNKLYEEEQTRTSKGVVM